MTSMFLTAARVLYLFSPLLFAAALAALVQRLDLLPWLRRPIDAGKTLHGKRWLGDGKTWRGVAVAIGGCTAAVAVQKHALGELAARFALIDYRDVHVLALGAAMGGGAMAGELPNSFVKRRLGIAAGRTARGPLSVLFYVWDQIDMLTTAWPSLAFWLRPTPVLVAMSTVLMLVMHPGVSLIGYLMGARRSAR